MRLFLSSYRAGQYDKELLRFLGGIKKVAVITNAKDYKTPQDRRLKIKENFDYYRSIGLEPTEINLRPYFHKTGAKDVLAKYEFIWLAGGNVFLLRRALSYTNLDRYLYAKARKEEITLAGESAGAIIIGPTLKYSEMDTDEDSPDFIPKGYDKEIIWKGLNITNFVTVPHYAATGYENSINEYINNLERNKIAYKKIKDDQAIIINGDKEEFLK